MLKHLNIGSKSLASGGILFVVGLVVFIGSWSYEIGSLRRMGPGYFPMLLGAALCMFAVLIVGLEFFNKKNKSAESSKTEDIDGIALRPMIMLPVAILLFALLLESWGLVPAVFACVTAAGLAEKQNRWPLVLLIAVSTVLFTSLVFVYALGVPLRLLVV